VCQAGHGGQGASTLNLGEANRILFRFTPVALVPALQTDEADDEAAHRK
jgi:hypothetical protein